MDRRAGAQTLQPESLQRNADDMNILFCILVLMDRRGARLPASHHDGAGVMVPGFGFAPRIGGREPKL